MTLSSHKKQLAAALATSKPRWWFWVFLVEITLKEDFPDGVGEIWENLVIIKAIDATQAYEKAMALGTSNVMGPGKGLMLDGKPAKNEFLGISDMGALHDGLVDGAEIIFRERRGYKAKAISKLPSKEALMEKANQDEGHARGSWGGDPLPVEGNESGIDESK